MKSYSIHTRNQTGTTNYYLGVFKTKKEAHKHAVKNYGWYKVSPKEYSIISEEVTRWKT